VVHELLLRLGTSRNLRLPVRNFGLLLVDVVVVPLGTLPVVVRASPDRARPSDHAMLPDPAHVHHAVVVLIVGVRVWLQGDRLFRADFVQGRRRRHPGGTGERWCRRRGEKDQDRGEEQQRAGRKLIAGCGETSSHISGGAAARTRKEKGAADANQVSDARI